MSARAPSLLPNPLGGERHVWRWRGHDVAYITRGDGAPVVFLHSIHAAAWSGEWRRNFTVIPDGFRAVALDLLGFGASARPPLHYDAPLYLELIRDFLREVVQAPAILVGSSLGGTYAVAIAHRHPEMVRAVCAIGPAGVTRLVHRGGAAGAVVQGLFRTPGLGATLFGLLVSRLSIRTFLRDIYSDPRALDPETIELFHVSANQPGARFAPAAFVGMQLAEDIRAALPALTVPVLLVWGEQARQTPLKEAAFVRALAPRATYAAIPGGDLPHDECPDAFNPVLRRFITTLPPLANPGTSP